MRIAVTCSGYGLVSRGVETFLRDLMYRLRQSRSDWAFDVYTRAPSGRECDGIHLIHVPAVSRDSRLATLYARIGHRLGFYLRTRNNAEGLSFALAVTPRLLTKKYDLVFNQAGPFSGWALGAHRRFGGPPFVHKTASGYSPLELIMKKQRPDLTIATSPFVRDWLLDQPPDVPITCIPNAVDCSKFRPSANGKQQDVPEELADLQRPIVLSVGAAEPMKRQSLAIRAVGRLQRGSLVIIGSGMSSQDVAEEGEGTLGASRFRLIPRVAHDDLPEYYHCADVFTLASEEPFGIVFLEALACNVPIVANHSPVQRWIAGDAGLTCDCEDAVAYAETLQRALDMDFGDLPRSRAEDFDWSVVAREYEQAFLAVYARERGAESQSPLLNTSGRLK